MKSHVSHQGREKKPPVVTPRPGTAPSSTVLSRSQPVSPCDDLHILITKRAYELYTERGYRHGYALDDWLEAEREILSQILPV